MDYLPGKFLHGQQYFYSNADIFALTVANDQLRGKTEEERVQVIQWFGFADSEILPGSSAWVFPLLGIMPYNKQVKYSFISLFFNYFSIEGLYLKSLSFYKFWRNKN